MTTYRGPDPAGRVIPPGFVSPSISSEGDKKQSKNGTAPPDPMAEKYKVIRVWEQNEPPARAWALAGWVPDGAITVLFGDGGTGKSYLALYIATLSCLGSPFLGAPMEQRAALYLDAELDHEEFERRAYKVARGLGLARPPEGLYYLRLPGSIAKPEIQGAVATIIGALEVGLTILDSLSIGAAGDNPSEAGDIIKTMTGLSTWGTVLAIDHISKPHAGANLSYSTSFGSVFKRNIARSAIRLIQTEAGGLTLQCDKSNFGPRPSPLYLTVRHDRPEDEYPAVTFTIAQSTDDDLAGITDHLPAFERIYHALAEQDDRKGSLTWLVESTGLSYQTVRNNLTALRKKGRALTDGNGTWTAIGGG